MLYQSEPEHMKDGKYLTGKAKEALIVVVIGLFFLFIFTSGSPQSVIGWQKTPGAFFEKRNYSTKLYAYVTKKGSSRSYRVPADISKGCFGDNGDGGCEPQTYELSNFYWQNGGYAS